MSGAMSPAHLVPCRLVAAVGAVLSLASAPFLGAVATVAASAGCGKESSSVKGAPTVAPAMPVGTVLMLDAQPITEEEVDRVAGAFARLQPQYVLAHCRRLALTNVVFPEVAARTVDPGRRETARALAEQYEAGLRAGTLSPGPLAGPTEKERSGGVKELGLEAWAAVIDAPVGTWSSVLETPGAFELVRLVERTPATAAFDVQMKVGVFTFPYIDEAAVHDAIDAALDRSTLVFVDPSWSDYVPSPWQHRLHAQTP